MSALIRYQMALWTLDLIKKTGTDPNWSWAIQRRRGIASIRTGLDQIFVGIDEPSVLQKWQDDEGGEELYRTNKKTGKFRIRRKLLKTSMADWHRERRDKRTGRVRKPNAVSDAWGGRMPIPTKIIEKFHRDLSKDVGKTKAGWIPAANYFKAKANGIAVGSTPGWVTRHGGWASAYGKGYEQGSWLSGTITAVAENNVPWARDWAGIMNLSLRTRQRDIQTQLIKRVDTLKRLARM